MSISDYLKVRTVSTSCFFCAVLNVESSGVGLVLLGPECSLGSLDGNLVLELSEYLRSFLL